MKITKHSYRIVASAAAAAIAAGGVLATTQAVGHADGTTSSSYSGDHAEGDHVSAYAAGYGSAGNPTEGKPATAPATAPWSKSTVRLRAALSGDQEVDTVGDPDATASITIKIDPTSGRVAYRKFVQSNLLAPEGETITNLHIHQGARGTNGDVVVDLTEAASKNLLSGSVTVDPAITARIAANPGNYYVNVHTAEFPKGAVRGQLGSCSTMAW
ncbi:MAG: CHRD domain-containing protein [Nocardioides sp.]